MPFDQWHILGDATESSLTRFAGRHIKEDYEIYVKQYPKVFEGKSWLDADWEWEGLISYLFQP